ncbi:hypothetical protein Nepgr_001669 [Nepenthes gracilis]|uniref:Uncharacterized protein n=1 Tax=Nepenthes gracilis TaxID=150966 RepID=A0AAD3P6F4_NEPGR|nr:hypothetical protein Nepgr_001669 [Nepenthes gracilis]
MEDEASPFETSEMMGSFLASTPLLEASWNLCSRANATAPGSFLTGQVESADLIAFSGTEFVNGSEADTDDLVPLAGVLGGLFSALDCRDGSSRGGGTDDERVMVHAGLLKRFLSIFESPGLQNRMKAMEERKRSVVLTVLCITFGSPLLGNKSLIRAILRQRWGGNFCHVVMRHDIVPRLLFAPLASLNTQLLCLLRCGQLPMMCPHSGQPAIQISNEQKAQLLRFVLDFAEARLTTTDEDMGTGLFWPFGTYLFCSEGGAICVDGHNTVATAKLLHLILATATATSCIDDHLKYGECVQKISLQFLKTKGFMEGNPPESSYEAGLALALESSGLASQELISISARDCLQTVRQINVAPTLNCANLAKCLSKITRNRAQIEWYKASCDVSDEQMGYYDSFKQNQASMREAHVNKFRIKLARFWDGVINMIDNNELPYDFHTRSKWINASHFYQLLVEPLDIAEYYRTGMHHKQGHYLKHGRERRHEIFDKWWKGKNINEEENKRRNFAGLTQDSCFWARVEEAQESLEKVRSERNPMKLAELWQGVEEVAEYARKLIENKRVSKDVLAKKSSYSLLEEELVQLRDMKSKLQQFPPQFPGLLRMN